ncbi:MAG: GtrA family protein [Oscillospiraceae bacterium]|nr:GtrA family protein [Oscillospiraceae bacterium]
MKTSQNSIRSFFVKYWTLLKYSLASLTSWALDAGLFYVINRALLGAVPDLKLRSMICNVLARAVSSFYNFNVNRRLVFENRDSYGKAILRYYCLAVPILIASTAIGTLIDEKLGVSAPELQTMVKVIVDTVLYLASYLLQKKWVFAKKAAPEEAPTNENEKNGEA